MSVKLTIELEGPVSPDDKDILTGATMILMALTQQVVGDTNEEEQPEQPTQPSEAEVEAFVAVLSAMPTIPEPCGKTDDDGRTCHGIVGHRGRHLFRKPASLGGMN